MASSAQILANQKNALLSTGPKTPEGKSAAARNSIKHGLSGAFTVLPHEDQDEFDILLACLRDEMAPANEHESFLVEQMAQSRWRLRRLQRLENAALELLMEIEQGSPLETLDSDHRIAARMIQGRGDALPRSSATPPPPSAPTTKRTKSSWRPVVQPRRRLYKTNPNPPRNSRRHNT